MEFVLEREKFYPLIRPVTEALGHRIVELKSRTVAGQIKVSLVLYNPRGLGLNDCAEVYRTLLSRIEVSAGTRDVHLEVSSPGLGRGLKSLDEVEVFKGLAAGVLYGEPGEWRQGRLGELEGEALELLPPAGADGGSAPIKLLLKDIKKIKLL
jgi:ribosome maturation factor RimP